MKDPGEEHRGFAEPDKEIIDYAHSHTIQLDLRSKVVQRVLHLRIAMDLSKEGKNADSHDWRHWQEE